MTCAATTCRMAILATTLSLFAAAPNGWAEESASPRLAVRARGNVLDTPRGPSAASDLGPTGQSISLGKSHLERAEVGRSESRAPCWGWCTVGVMSLAILGLFSFGWHDACLPVKSEGVVQHEQPRTQPSCQAGNPAAAQPPRHVADAPRLSGGDAPPPTPMRPGHSVCIGICAGGDVWAVACGV